MIDEMLFSFNREFIFQVIFVILVGILAFGLHLEEKKPLSYKQVNKSHDPIIFIYLLNPNYLKIHLS